jgi:hypothetical protein
LKAESFCTSIVYIEGVDQTIDSLVRVVVIGRGKMSVSGSRQHTDMAQNLLQFNQVNARLQKVGGITVS